MASMTDVIDGVTEGKKNSDLLNLAEIVKDSSQKLIQIRVLSVVALGCNYM